MVANFAASGAAINQLAREARATLRVRDLALDHPTADFTQAQAMTEPEFLEAVRTGYDEVTPGTDLLALGEMGIGNTTAAAAIAAALFGGDPASWAGRGTGIDDAGLARKRRALEAALTRHEFTLVDPLYVAMALGGRELAAIMGAVLAARIHRVPVLLDGFVCTAAAAPWSVRPRAPWTTPASPIALPKPAMPPSPPPWANNRSWTSASASAKPPAPPSPSPSSAPRSPATSAWPPSPRPA